jgi:ATP-binding cassette subfamily B (MDR/TAP) protein 1
MRSFVSGDALLSGCGPSNIGKTTPPISQSMEPNPLHVCQASVQTMEGADQCPQSLFSLSISTLDTLPSGQASNTLTNTANVLQIGISEKLGIFLQFTALMITAVIIAFTYSWSLTLVTSSLLLFIGTVYGIIIPLVVKRNKEVEHADEKASSIAGEVLGSIRMIVACGAEGRVARKYSGWIQESLRRGLRLSPLIGIQFAPCKLAMD